MTDKKKFRKIRKNRIPSVMSGSDMQENMFSRQLEIPSHFNDSRSYKRFSLYQLIYSLCGLILGLVCVVGGIILFLNGIAGSTSWTAKIIGAKSEISDAAPGVVLFIVGLFVVLITRFNIKIKKV